MTVTTDGLTALFTRAVEKGMTHFSVYPIESGKNLIWVARAAPSTQHGYVLVEKPNIIDAITGVLENLPKAPIKAAKKKFDSVNAPISELAQRAVEDAGERDQQDPASDWMIK